MTLPDKTNALTGIKGFNLDLTCLGYKFEPGQTYTQEGTIACCKNGFHAIPDDVHPLTVFGYYPPGTSRYFEVVQSGDICRLEGDKAASSVLSVKVEISLGALTLRAIDWVMARVDKAIGTSNSGEYGAASNSSYRGAASNSGTQGAASNSGIRGAASNSGIRGAASNSGTQGAASNSGYRGAASNSGIRGAASNSGEYGAASNSGGAGAAFSHAFGGKVMCEGEGQALYCTEFTDDGSIASVACGITGRDGIRAGVWYHAKDGRLVEV